MGVPRVSARLAVGFGATSGAQAHDIVELVRASLAQLNPSAGAEEEPMPAFVLATLDRRASTAYDVARILTCDVVTFDAATLSGIGETTTRSARALASVGIASVAEAAALAALDTPRARLVVTRTTGRHCTCAIAESE